MATAVDDVEHGNGQRDRLAAVEVLVQGLSAALVEAARAAASETPRTAFAPRLPLLWVPSSSISRSSMARWSSADLPHSTRELSCRARWRLP